jgi:hypothetical protein
MLSAGLSWARAEAVNPIKISISAIVNRSLTTFPFMYYLLDFMDFAPDLLVIYSNIENLVLWARILY